MIMLLLIEYEQQVTDTVISIRGAVLSRFEVRSDVFAVDRVEWLDTGVGSRAGGFEEERTAEDARSKRSRPESRRLP